MILNIVIILNTAFVIGIMITVLGFGLLVEEHSHNEPACWGSTCLFGWSINSNSKSNSDINSNSNRSIDNNNINNHSTN